MRNMIEDGNESRPVQLVDIALAALELDRMDGPPVSWEDIEAKARELALRRTHG